MRKTLLTIATVGLLGLSTISGAFAQSQAALDNAASAANAACGGPDAASLCLPAVLAFKAILARSVGVTLTAPVVVNGVTIAATGTTITRTSAVSVYNSFVAEVQVVAQAAGSGAVVAAVAAELGATAADIAAASAS